MTIFQVKPSLYVSDEPKDWPFIGNQVHNETIRPKLNSVKELKEVQIDLQGFFHFIHRQFFIDVLIFDCNS